MGELPMKVLLVDDESYMTEYSKNWWTGKAMASKKY